MSEKTKDVLISLFSELLGRLSVSEQQDLLKRLHVRDRPSELHAENIPLSIFHSELSGLEAIVVYLVDFAGITKSAAAAMLNRDPNTIYTTYSNAKTKLKTPLETTGTKTVPLSIFSDRNFAILESLTNHLKQHDKMRLADISRLLDKSPSTIKTVYARYRKKAEEVKTRG